MIWTWRNDKIKKWLKSVHVFQQHHEETRMKLRVKVSDLSKNTFWLRQPEFGRTSASMELKETMNRTSPPNLQFISSFIRTDSVRNSQLLPQNIRYSHKIQQDQKERWNLKNFALIPPTCDKSISTALFVTVLIIWTLCSCTSCHPDWIKTVLSWSLDQSFFKSESKFRM